MIPLCCIIYVVVFSFLGEPEVLLSGTAQEQAKFYLNDPSNNVIEVKTYRDPAGTLMLDGHSGVPA
jgi:extradiol dioxygenase family protein